MKKNWRSPAIISFIASLIILLIIVTISTSTYDTGDSIMHYLYSRYSWQVHYFFLHMWGKPLFILLSSPFAQFGFSGMKVFQALVWSLAVFFAVRCAEEMRLKYSWIAAIIMLSIPQLVLSTASGLTEPLFAMWTIAGIYFFMVNKNAVAAILFSFLLYARSEGQIVDIVVIVYMLFSRKWKYMPLLFTSLIVYGVIGLFFNANFFFYFTNNPYNHPPGFYGYGTWDYYLNEMNVIIGKPIYVLAKIGIISIAVLMIKKILKKDVPFFNERLFLIYGITLAYFGFHSISWWKGLFGSFGMPRVMLAIMPMVALMALDGLLLITGILRIAGALVEKVAISVAVVFIVSFPFMKNVAAYHFPGDFQPNDEGQVVTQACEWLQKESGLTGNVYFSDPYASVVLKNVEVFDKDLGDFKIFKDPKQLPPGSVYIWDSWYSVTERKAKLEDLTGNNLFTSMKCFDSKSDNPWHICVLKKN